MAFKNRQEAGHLLAEKLASLQHDGQLNLDHAVVIALPRGGVPVGYEIAQQLKLPLDVCVVRKVGAPGQPELAVAAVAEGGEISINQNIRHMLGLSTDDIHKLAQPKHAEVIDRIHRFRPNQNAVDIKGKSVILVDDGMATGATARSAINLLKKKRASKIILALPVCPADAVAKFSSEVDLLVTLLRPKALYSVGKWYDDFTQVSDNEVKKLLQQARDLELADE